MTAYAVAQLVELGNLDLDAPVQTYVPKFPQKRAPISSRQLLGHLSGIRHYAGNEFLSRKHYETVSAGLLIFQNDPLVNMPGEAFLFSSYGYNLLGAVIEGASGSRRSITVQSVTKHARCSGLRKLPRQGMTPGTAWIGASQSTNRAGDGLVTVAAR